MPTKLANDFNGIRYLSSYSCVYICTHMHIVLIKGLIDFNSTQYTDDGSKLTDLHINIPFTSSLLTSQSKYIKINNIWDAGYYSEPANSSVKPTSFINLMIPANKTFILKLFWAPVTLPKVTRSTQITLRLEILLIIDNGRGQLKDTTVIE